MLRVFAALRPLLLPAARLRPGALRPASATAGAAGSGPDASDDEDGEEEDDDDDDDWLGEPTDEAELALGADAGDTSSRPQRRFGDEEQGPDGWHYAAKLFDAPASVDIASYWHNAVLSEASKETIYDLHASDPVMYNAAKLAQDYGVRQQRIIAILTLKKIERELEAKGWPLAKELAAMTEEKSLFVAERGTGELFVETVPSLPHFEVVPDELPAAQMPIEVNEAAKKAASDKLDRVMVSEFITRLKRNTGELGGGLARKSRVTHAPKRPPGGWPLLVKPLGFGQNTEWALRNAPPQATPFVALPTGQRRELNADEKDMIDSQRVKPRRRFS